MGIGAWALVMSGNDSVPGVSVSVVLFPTDTGAATQDGASEGATSAPTSEHEDDNSLGYTGTDTAAVSCYYGQLVLLCVCMCVCCY